MDVQEFREKVTPQSTIIVENVPMAIETKIKFRFDDGSYYIKCYLTNGMVFADDENENLYLLVKPVDTKIKRPFPKNLKYKGKEYNFLYTAHAVAEEVSNEKHFKLGEGETFWDYRSEDGSYLSLGINDWIQESIDFAGRILSPGVVTLK